MKRGQPKRAVFKGIALRPHPHSLLPTPLKNPLTPISPPRVIHFFPRVLHFSPHPFPYLLLVLHHTLPASPPLPSVRKS